jgi:hypothetical protein
MKTINNLILILSIFILLSCEKESESVNNLSNKLIGGWINPVLSDTIWTFDKSSNLIENEYCFAFKAESLFNERKNTNLCGNPPMTFIDFEGSWSLNDSILNITSEDWGGTLNYQWKLITIDETKFSVQKIKTEYPNETTNNFFPELLGNWINPIDQNGFWTYDKTENLLDNDYGLSFKSEQVFNERKNSGWCGTPPITYADYEGSWFQNDSIVNISVGYWGGEISYQWKIILIENDKLTIIKCF